MDSIIRGTTPTVKYTFKTVNPSDISVAYLTAQQGDDIVIEKPLSSATAGEHDLSWILTQEETLGLDASMVQFMLNWKTNGGTRGASNTTNVMVKDNQKPEVI